MKKLSITKEAFEKSKYFTGKYGKLEYVSESGKLFKTDKGKILMFKESKMVNEGLFSDIGSDIGYRIDDGIKGLKKVFRGKPKFKVGDELEWKYPKGDEWYPFVVKDVQWIDGQWRYGDENAETYRPHGFWSRDYWHPQGWCRPKQGTSESTKKFGKKFKESVDTYDEFEALGDKLEAKYKRCKYAEAELYVDDEGSYTIAVRIDTKHKDESREMNRFLAQQSRKYHWRLEKEPDIYDPVMDCHVDEFYLYVI